MKNWQRNLAIAAGVGAGVVVISRQATAGVRNLATETGRLVDETLNPVRDTNLANRAVVGTLKFFGALPEDATTIAPLVPGFTRPGAHAIGGNAMNALRLIPILALVLLAACGSMPHLEQTRPLTAGSYDVCMTVELMPPAEVGRRCNFGMPSDIIGCTFPRANPPIVVGPVPENVNDWRSKGIIGHKVLHVLFGDYHK